MSKKNKSPLYFDEKNLMCGLFEMHDRHGCPLELSIRILKEKGLYGNHLDFAKQAFKVGWTLKRVVTTINEAYADNDIPVKICDIKNEKGEYNG